MNIARSPVAVGASKGIGASIEKGLAGPAGPAQAVVFLASSDAAA